MMKMRMRMRMRMRMNSDAGLWLQGQDGQQRDRKVREPVSRDSVGSAKTRHAGSHARAVTADVMYMNMSTSGNAWPARQGRGAKTSHAGSHARAVTDPFENAIHVDFRSVNAS